MHYRLHRCKVSCAKTFQYELFSHCLLSVNYTTVLETNDQLYTRKSGHRRSDEGRAGTRDVG